MNSDPHITYWNEQGPEALLAIIRSAELPPHRLTYAAEAVGNIEDSEAAREVLLPLLSHESMVVREGAIYGISEHLDDASRQALRRLADSDPSPGVRTAAAGVLEVDEITGDRAL